MTTALKMLTAFLLGGGVVVALVMASCGGLMITRLSASEQSKASAWSQAGNFGGGSSPLGARQRVGCSGWVFS
jgi:hypothetical protein